MVSPYFLHVKCSDKQTYTKCTIVYMCMIQIYSNQFWKYFCRFQFIRTIEGDFEYYLKQEYDSFKL